MESLIDLNIMKIFEKLKNKVDLIFEKDTECGIYIKSESEIIYFNAEDFIYNKKKKQFKDIENEIKFPKFININTEEFTEEFGFYNKKIQTFDIDNLLNHYLKMGANLNGTEDIKKISEIGKTNGKIILKIKTNKEYKYSMNYNIGSFLILSHDIMNEKYNGDNDLKIKMKMNHVNSSLFLNIKYKNEEQLIKLHLKKYTEIYE